MTGIAILRTTGWLYAGLCAFCAVALVADGLAGVGERSRFGLGVTLLIIPFGMFSFLLLNFSNRHGSKTDFAGILSLLAILYFLVNRIYGFFYWYTTGNASLLITWASLPIVWLELTICLALGLALWTRREMIWWVGLCLGIIQFYQAVTIFPSVINSYPSVRYFWPDIAPQVFKIVWLLTFIVLLAVQLLERKQHVPAG